jgi:hypothetical protein
MGKKLSAERSIPRKNVSLLLFDFAFLTWFSAKSKK